MRKIVFVLVLIGLIFIAEKSRAKQFQRPADFVVRSRSTDGPVYSNFQIITAWHPKTQTCYMKGVNGESSWTQVPAGVCK